MILKCLSRGDTTLKIKEMYKGSGEDEISVFILMACLNIRTDKLEI